MYWKTPRTKYSIDEVIDYYGVGRFTVRLMAVLGILCLGFGAVSSTFLSSLSLIWQCQRNLDINPTITWLVVMSGYSLGSIFYGWLADRQGRKLMISFTAFICWYFSLLPGLKEGENMLLMLNVFFASTGFYGRHIMTNYSSEAFPKRYRPKLQTYLGICLACGGCVAPLIAYFTYVTSRQLLIVISLPLTISLALPLWFPESISYLQITNNQEELHWIFNRISKEHNKRKPKHCQITTKHIASRGSLSSLFKRGTVLNTTIMILMWITCQLALSASVILQGDILTEKLTCKGYSYPLNNIAQYNRSSICSLTDLDLHQYATSSYGALAELAGLFVCLFVIDILSRRQLFIIGFIATGIGFSLLNICTLNVIHEVAMLVTRGLSAAISQVLFIFTNEMYPTSIRCTVTGFLSFIASLSVVVIPLQVNFWLHLSPRTLSNICVFFCILACLCCPLLRVKKHSSNIV